MLSPKNGRQMTLDALIDNNKMMVLYFISVRHKNIEKRFRHCIKTTIKGHIDLSFVGFVASKVLHRDKPCHSGDHFIQHSSECVQGYWEEIYGMNYKGIYVFFHSEKILRGICN